MCSLSSAFAATSAGVDPRSEPFESFEWSCSAACCPGIAPKGTVAARAAPSDVTATIRREPMAAKFLRRRYCLDGLNLAIGINAAVPWIKGSSQGSTAAGAARRLGCPSVVRPCSSERSAAAREAIRVGHFPAPHIR